MHFEVYYKDQLLWKKFQIDLWENFCNYLDNRKKSFFIDWTVGRFFKYVKYDGPLKCPLRGNLSLNISKMSLSQISADIPFIPSGHYRIDVTNTEANRKNVYSKAQIYIEQLNS